MTQASKSSSKASKSSGSKSGGSKSGGLTARVKKLFSRENLPKSKGARIAIGVLLVVGGLIGFLPILGFWMVPMGLAVLAIDIPVVRRFTRKATLWAKRLWNKVRS